MLSDDQLIALENIYFEEQFLPKMISYLREEGVRETDQRLAVHLKKLHNGLARIRIHSPRNTFRFYRLSLKQPDMSEGDNRYFCRVILNTSIEESARLDLIEKNILHENNVDRWPDLQ
ncbi:MULTISPECIES: hypothetical protein [Agrobacterium]|jgi:hypothetical protein|uniref:Uncharacterized protein n=2 Tax=Agrobacterium tumefaciens complex TaxID=1183400 RepID=A0AAW8M2Q9_AGRTU|nr:MULTISPECIES: hypothetical protein [Agrobacterium]EHH05433.1 hypothetical protein ATCR1_14921 [Agrobacterium tumefaciens CCNWGS0286]MBP2540827.1 hypothetical protein [Agrobacterium tumefaciens]MBP2568772.1 hypothetical protein [Agrobacterium tumefaciens]MDR6705570.1 hypothetical protein [Agrobacterium tumefaciens]QXC48611.1 hypothetical protein KHC17_00320 [Agrobacterium salinitolerans]